MFEVYPQASEVQDANNNDVIIEMQPAPIPDQEDEEDEGFSETEDMDESLDDILNNIINNNSNDNDDDNDDDNNIDNNNSEMPLHEPAEGDIDAWMTPKRAREKELLLLAQYRRCQKLARQRTYAIEAQKKQRDKMTNLSKKLKRQTLRVKGLEKIIRDILNVKWSFTFQTSYDSSLYWIS